MLLSLQMAKSTKSRKNRNRQVSTKSTGKASRSPQSSRAAKGKAVMVFSKQNYLLMILGMVLVIFGYYIMRMENEVDGFISLYVAPLIILGGYLEIIYAILWRPKTKSSEDSAPSAAEVA